MPRCRHRSRSRRRRREPHTLQSVLFRRFCIDRKKTTLNILMQHDADGDDDVNVEAKYV